MSNIRFRFSSNESPFGAILSHRNKSRFDSCIEIWKNSMKKVKTPRRFQKLCYCTISKKYKALYIVVKAKNIKFGINYQTHVWFFFSILHFYICKLQFRPRLFLFIIDSLKIISLKLIAILSFCLYAEDQSRNLHHKFFKFQNKQTRNWIK